MLAETFPADAVRRVELRAMTRARYVPAARWAALASLMSLHCAGVARAQAVGDRYEPHPWHAKEPGGCADSGATCLCICHDEE